MTSPEPTMAGGAGSEPGRATVSPEQLPVGKAIALHLFPGVALVSIMYLLQPAMAAIRAPRFLGFLFAGRRRGRLGARILVAEGPSQRRFPLAGCRPLPGARPQAPLPGGADAVWMAAARVGHLESVLALQEGMFSWLPSWTSRPRRPIRLCSLDPRSNRHPDAVVQRVPDHS